jgi:queuine tRNA-ribosyltransferase
MPVGTCAPVKGLSPEEVADCGAQIVLANTYHLFLRPGADIVQKAGGIHKFMNWDKPILTDSGGFQVFSLDGLRKLTEDGVEFKSHLDGSKFKFTPELNMQVQHKIGADIIMQLDVCAPIEAKREEVERAAKLSRDWLERCVAEHEKLNDGNHALFPIIQGGFHADLRLESTKACVPFAKHGIAAGGIALGETPEELSKMLAVMIPHLPDTMPHYLMGAGSPDYILAAVEHGFDMFDCVYQTRMARTGTAMVDEGRLNLRNAKFREDFSPIEKGCTCEACKKYTRAYISHLVRCGEMFGLRLIAIHNIHWTLRFVERIRESIRNDNFLQFKEQFLLHYKPNCDKN